MSHPNQEPQPYSTIYSILQHGYKSFFSSYSSPEIAMEVMQSGYDHAWQTLHGHLFNELDDVTERSPQGKVLAVFEKLATTRKDPVLEACATFAFVCRDAKRRVANDAEHPLAKLYGSLYEDDFERKLLSYCAEGEVRGRYDSSEHLAVVLANFAETVVEDRYFMPPGLGDWEISLGVVELMDQNSSR